MINKDTLTGDNCSCMFILPKAIRAINKIKSKTLISEIKASLSSPLLDAITGAMATSFSKKYCHCDGKLRLQQSNVKKKNKIGFLYYEMKTKTFGIRQTISSNTFRNQCKIA